MSSPLPVPLLNFLDLPSLTQIIGLVLVGASLLLMYRLISLWRESQAAGLSTGVGLPKDVGAVPRQLFTKEEAVLFNLVYLAVRDSYFVLAKLPMRSFLKITAGDDAVRKSILKPFQKFSVDFVLVHPGTLRPVKVVLLDHKEMNPERDVVDTQLFHTICQQANIEVIRLQADLTYTVPDLTKVFGLEDDA